MISRNILLGLGILALVAGALLAVLWFRQPSARTAAAAAAPAPTELVLVATHWVPAGALLRPGDVTWGKMVVADAVGTDIVQGSINQSDYVGAVTRRAFAAGEPIWAIALIKPGDSEFLVAALRPGFRAVSIAVDAPQGGAGLVLPGDHVDVILTQSFGNGGTDAGHKSVGETVLHDLRVIAVDQTLVVIAKPAEPGGTPGDARIPKTVTLEVTEREAEQVLVAEQLGKIELSLLGLVDQQATTTVPSPETTTTVPSPDIATPPVWASDVSPALAGATDASSAELPGPVEVLHGSKIERRCSTRTGLITCP